MKKYLKIFLVCSAICMLSFLCYRSYSLDGSISATNIALTDVGNEYYEARDENKNVVPILVYHKIQPETLLDTLLTREFILAKETFEEQIVYILGEGYTPLTMHELIGRQNNNNLPKKPIVITFDDGWLGQYTDALPILVKYKIPATFYIIDAMLGKDNYMTLKQVKDLHDLGFEIGGHTVHHPRLTLITLEQAHNEIAGNKLYLETMLQDKIYSFCYPYGNFNLDIENELKNNGYESARTSIKSVYNDFSNFYELKAIYATASMSGFKRILQN